MIKSRAQQLFKDMIAELGRLLELGAVVPNDKDAVSFTIDKSWPLEIVCLGPWLRMAAIIGDAQDMSSEHLQALLAANFQRSELLGMSIAIQPKYQKLLLIKEMKLFELSGSKLFTGVQELIEATDLWRTRLSAPLKEFAHVAPLQESESGKFLQA